MHNCAPGEAGNSAVPGRDARIRLYGEGRFRKSGADVAKLGKGVLCLRRDWTEPIFALGLSGVARSSKLKEWSCGE